MQPVRKLGRINKCRQWADTDQYFILRDLLVFIYFRSTFQLSCSGSPAIFLLILKHYLTCAYTYSFVHMYLFTYVGTHVHMYLCNLFISLYFVKIQSLFLLGKGPVVSKNIFTYAMKKLKGLPRSRVIRVQ
jgi:hypothetical protein